MYIVQYRSVLSADVDASSSHVAGRKYSSADASADLCYYTCTHLITTAELRLQIYRYLTKDASAKLGRGPVKQSLLLASPETKILGLQRPPRYARNMCAPPFQTPIRKRFATWDRPLHGPPTPKKQQNPLWYPHLDCTFLELQPPLAPTFSPSPKFLTDPCCRQWRF